MWTLIDGSDGDDVDQSFEGSEVAQWFRFPDLCIEAKYIHR